MPRSASAAPPPGSLAHLKDSRGRLTKDALRAFVQMVRDGAGSRELASAFSLSIPTARERLAQIRAALSLPSASEHQAAKREEIEQRAARGEREGDIAAAVGLSIDRVQRVLYAAGRGRWRKLPLSAGDEAEADRRLLAGESTRAVAAALGVHQAVVWRRRGRLRDQIATGVPPCHCGRPASHHGRCATPVDPAHLRARLLAGATAAELARQAGITPQHFKPRYVQPVIDQLTAEGHRCGCGQPFGHPVNCAFTARPKRVTLTDDQDARALELVRAGAVVSKVAIELGLSDVVARRVVRSARAQLAAEGAGCPCGRPLLHRGTCSARDPDFASKRGFAFSPTVTMPTQARHKASRLARQGWGVGEIVKRTGETASRVSVLVGELKRAGLLPQKCAGCDRPYGHRGACLKPAACGCGRPRNHRGPCRRADGRRRSPPPKLPAEAVAAIRTAYRARASIRSISRSTGVAFGVVQRMVKRWREDPRSAPPACACGRPAFHPGGCEANTPGALGRRWIARIEAMVEGGTPVHRIADALNISLAAAQKHSRAKREELFRNGVTCACGRMIGHPFWCSAKWDAWEMPRGPRPAKGPPFLKIEKAVPEAASISGDDLLARIQSAVPRGLDGSLRDDIVGELNLAVLEGRLAVEQIGAAVRSFVSRGLRDWQSRFGPRSLDAQLGDEGSATLGDLVADHRAGALVDEIELG